MASVARIPGFRILSYNCLRSGYQFEGKYWCQSPQVRSWLNTSGTEGEKPSQNSQTTRKDDAAVSGRKERLASQLRAFPAEIYCLQEVENPMEDLPEELLDPDAFAMHRGGRKRQDAHTRPLTLFRRERFACEWERIGSRVLILCLRDLLCDRVVYVANAHLQGGRNGGEARAEQVASAFRHIRLHLSGTPGGHAVGIVQKSSNQGKETQTTGDGGDGDNGGPPSVIFCGDFNCTQGDGGNEFLFAHFETREVEVNGGCEFHSIHGANQGRGTGLPYTFKVKMPNFSLLSSQPQQHSDSHSLYSCDLAQCWSALSPRSSLKSVGHRTRRALLAH
jgi:endonuclease/exonuclease/phosphatase family metal-dependent hydrolase